MDKRKNLKVVEVFKKLISKKIDVKKIIFFGSRARGDFKENSDFDLIVVSDEFEGIKSYKRVPDMYRVWNLDYPVDFICLTSSEFEEMKKGVTVVSEALKEGIVI